MTIAALVRKTKTQKINHRRKTETGHKVTANRKATAITNKATETTSKVAIETNLKAIGISHKVTETNLKDLNLRIKVRSHLQTLTTNR